MQTLQELAEQNAGKTILVAAHGGSIRVTLMELLGLTYHDLPNSSFRNAGYIELSYNGANFKVMQNNGVSL